MRAVVVFTESDHSLAWLLKPGFRHCFVCLEDNGLWIAVDVKKGIPYVRYLTTADFDIAEFYRQQGMTAVETTRREKSITWPFAIRNCVGLVTTMLSVSAWIVTPYGLYKYLRRNTCN